MQMASLDSLDSSVQLSPISLDTKCEILQHLWDLTIQPSQFYDSDLDFDVYFRHYSEKCSEALYDGGRHVSIRTHRDIVEIAQGIKAGQDRGAIKNRLMLKLSQPKPANGEEVLDGSIDLVTRLLLMMDFGDLQYGFTGRRQILWTSGRMEECLKERYKDLTKLGSENVKLERIFNAGNLGRIAGIEIAWTSNMADHLRLVDEDKKVAIFYHASFLECQLQSHLYPAGLVEETIRTLALLFPKTDKTTRKWVRKTCAVHNLDRKVMKCGRLRAEDRHIENFAFWHDRLVTLKQVFDESEPGTISQW
ncbi:hypothetical protein BKA65DRAFT_492016 [Rhexocercosporidium sp. MPI-PUGE-AT-0058]|nr:hypothetical protein BKA65DRAFT_492016 [Rhexocercosporidium sp. MPI-PUGE-AT-0058]